MILRVDIDNIAAMVELDSEPWTPELAQTLLRLCGDEAIRTTTIAALAASQRPDNDATE